MDGEKTFWTFKEIGEEFGLDPSSVRRFVAKNGIETIDARTAESGNQLCKVLDFDGYSRFKDLREGFALAGHVNSTIANNEQKRTNGVFYFIRLVPEALPNRIKLGFTTDLKGRIQAHKCCAPTLEIMGTWGAKQEWESMAIAAITNMDGVVQVGKEVFDFLDAEKAFERAESFFSFVEPIG